MTDELTPELREAVERDYQRWHRTDSPTFRVLLTEWAQRVQRAEAELAEVRHTMLRATMLCEKIRARGYEYHADYMAAVLELFPAVEAV